MTRQHPDRSNGIESYEHFFLPRFCDVGMVFAVIVIAELLAFIVSLVSPAILANPWSDLGLISLFIQWIALTSAAVLCLTRPLLARLNDTAAALGSYLLVLLVTGIVSEMAFWLIVETEFLPFLDREQHAAFVLRNLFISTIVAAVVLRYLYVQFQWRQQVEAESRARVQALQARIRPHFLFNSMNTIAALVRSQPDSAETAIEDLSDLFRASLDISHGEMTLGDEIELARRYLSIEKLRLGDRLSVDWDLDAVPMDLRVPPLVLQPLLENAIYHGIEPLPDGGTIQVSGKVADHMLVLDIRNPVAAAGAGRDSGNRIAQENIRQRLQIAFGKQAQLKTMQRDGHYLVTLRLPVTGAV
ncbi:MAG: sensor histidine kinase [Gammaproteobacteria bacterium]